MDGNRNGDGNVQPCTSTKTQTVRSPWWAVDLGRVTSVLKVVISNRIDAVCELSVALYDVVRATRLEMHSATDGIAMLTLVLFCYLI